MIELLPSLRFGKIYSSLADGKKIYLSTENQLLCEHGELASTISFWTSIEKRAKIDGTEPPPRGGLQTPSICDCVTTEGMHCKLPDDASLPVKPPSLFEFLESNDAECVKIKGRDARRIPYVSGPTFVSTLGTLPPRRLSAQPDQKDQDQCRVQAAASMWVQAESTEFEHWTQGPTTRQVFQAEGPGVREL